MLVGCPITSSPFTLHKPMNNQPNPNPNPNPTIQTQIENINHHPIERALSADMSSPDWLENNCFSFPDRLSGSAEEVDGSAKVVVTDEDDEKKGAFEDIWSSILTQKGTGSGGSSGFGVSELPPPYVHPMVKRTTSSLSEKSLEICTESLGSETGSDGFSFPEPAEGQHMEHVDDGSVCWSNGVVDGSSLVGLTMDLGGLSSSQGLSSVSKLRGSFPPPLPSLANHDGSNVHMRSLRGDGRLVLEAVAVPAHNCFKAQREDGRLLLTLSGDDDDDALEVDDEVEFDDIDTGYECLKEEGDGSCMNSPMEMAKLMQQETTPPLIMSKFKWLNTSKPRNVNTTIDNDRSEVEDQHRSLLPPRPKMSMATASSVLNGYEYYWRKTRTAMAVLKPLASQHNPSAASQVVVVKGDQKEKEGEYLPFLRGCYKEPKRSLLLWEPHCIATS